MRTSPPRRRHPTSSPPDTAAVPSGVAPRDAVTSETVRSSVRAWLSVVSLALGAFVIVTTEFIPVGFLPRIAGSLGVSLGAAGLMVLVPGLSAAVAAPVIFVAAWRLNRRHVIVILGGLVMVSNAVAAVAPSFGVVLGARVLLGLAIGGFWTVVPPAGAKLVGRRASTRATSVIIAGVSAGTVVGLPAGQFLGDLLGWRMTFAAAAGAALLIVSAQLVLLPGIPPAGRLGFGRLGDVFRVRVARAAVAATAVVFVGQFAASTFVTPFLLVHAHQRPATITALFLAYGVAGIAGTLAGGPLVARGRTRAFAGAAAGVGVVLAVLPVLGSASAPVGVLVVGWGLIWGVIPLAVQVWLLGALPHAQEAASAVGVSTMQISIAAGSAVGGLLVDSAGLTTVFTAGGAIALAGALLALTTGRRSPVPIEGAP